MPISDYLRDLRADIGTKPLLTPGVDALIRDADGALLLIRRTDDGLWALPGGQLEPLEPPALGVVREVFEETGLKVRPVSLLGVFGGLDVFHLRYPNGDEVDPVVSLFRCEILGEILGEIPGESSVEGLGENDAGALQNRDGEASAVRFFPPDMLPLDLTPITRYLLARVAEGQTFAWDERWLMALG